MFIFEFHFLGYTLGRATIWIGLLKMQTFRRFYFFIKVFLNIFSF